MRSVPTDPGLATILVHDGGAKTMVLAPGANDAFSQADAENLAKDLQDAPEGSVLVVDNELSSPAIEAALDAARHCGRPILTGCPLVETVRLGVAAAACAVTGFGPQESYPDRFALAAMARKVRVAPSTVAGRPSRRRVIARWRARMAGSFVTPLASTLGPP